MPHTNLVAWIDAPLRVEIDRDGVQLILSSGQAEFISRMSPATFRQACVCGLRKLNAWEDAQEGVTPLPIKAASGH